MIVNRRTHKVKRGCMEEAKALVKEESPLRRNFRAWPTAIGPGRCRATLAISHRQRHIQARPRLTDQSGPTGLKTHEHDRFVSRIADVQ